MVSSRQRTDTRLIYWQGTSSPSNDTSQERKAKQTILIIGSAFRAEPAIRWLFGGWQGLAGFPRWRPEQQSAFTMISNGRLLLGSSRLVSVNING
jgi:hypothetical protein